MQVGEHASTSRKETKGTESRVDREAVILGQQGASATISEERLMEQAQAVLEGREVEVSV